MQGKSGSQFNVWPIVIGRVDEGDAPDFIPFIKSTMGEVEDYDGGWIENENGRFEIKIASCLWDEKCER